MISFNCLQCGHLLTVDDDSAGVELQCPRCGILNSVPLHSELGNLNDDGTLKVADFEATDDPNRLQTMARAFGRTRVDAQTGEEIDNRTLPETIELAPVVPQRVTSQPRYDPETGELVTAIGIAPERPIAAIPVVAVDQRSISYATPGRTENVGTGGVWIRLFEPQNVTVMAFVVAAHFAWGIFYPFLLFLTLALVKLGLALPVWPFNIPLWLVLAHYANTVEETGREERDELPRPLRQMSFGEDFFYPLCLTFISFLFAYWPALILLRGHTTPSRALAATALILGGFAFPAVYLTMCNGKSLSNLRPDRLMRVVARCGLAYFRIAFMTAVVIPLYLFTCGPIDLLTPLLEDDTPFGNAVKTIATRSWFTFPLFILLVYVAHGIAWRLGQLFRLHGQHFKWKWEQFDHAVVQDRRRRNEQRQKAQALRRTS